MSNKKIIYAFIIYFIFGCFNIFALEVEICRHSFQSAYELDINSHRAAINLLIFRNRQNKNLSFEQVLEKKPLSPEDVPKVIEVLRDRGSLEARGLELNNASSKKIKIIENKVYEFIVLVDGRIFIGEGGHIQVGGLQNVLTAGELTFVRDIWVDGRVYLRVDTINNKSGTYKPKFESLVHLINAFFENGMWRGLDKAKIYDESKTNIILDLSEYLLAI